DAAVSPQEVRQGGVGLGIAAAGTVQDAGEVTLVAGRCPDCDARSWPYTPLCYACLCTRVEPMPLGRTGRLYAFTEIVAAPAGRKAPYTVGYVDMPEGVRILAHLDAAPDELAIDGAVVLTAAPDDPGPPFEF